MANYYFLEIRYTCVKNKSQHNSLKNFLYIEPFIFINSCEMMDYFSTTHELHTPQHTLIITQSVFKLWRKELHFTCT